MKWVEMDFAKAALALRNQAVHGAQQREAYLKATKDWEAARPDEDTRVKHFAAVDAKAVAAAESLGSVKNHKSASEALVNANTNDTTAAYLVAKATMNPQEAIITNSAGEVDKSVKGVWEKYNSLHNKLAPVRDALVVLDKILASVPADTTAAAPASVDVAAEKAKLEAEKAAEKEKFDVEHKDLTKEFEFVKAQALQDDYDVKINNLDAQIAALETSGGDAPAAAAAAGPVVDVATQLKAVNEALVGIREGDIFSDNCAKLNHNNTIKSGMLKRFKKGAEHTTKELVVDLTEEAAAVFTDFAKLPAAETTLKAFQATWQATKWDAAFGVPEEGFDAIAYNFGLYADYSNALNATGEALHHLSGLVNCKKSDDDGVKWEEADI